MDGLVWLGLALVAGVALLLWRRHRARGLPLVARGVRCPLHDCQAEVTVRTDPEAPPHRRYVDVVGCSLLSDLAVALPERTAYLPDSTPCRVLLDPARTYPVYATEVTCAQPCVFALNAAVSPATPQPLTCSSGVSDSIDLMRQVDSRAGDSRLLWYGSV